MADDTRSDALSHLRRRRDRWVRMWDAYVTDPSVRFVDYVDVYAHLRLLDRQFKRLSVDPGIDWQHINQGLDARWSPQLSARIRERANRVAYALSRHR